MAGGDRLSRLKRRTRYDFFYIDTQRECNEIVSYRTEKIRRKIILLHCIEIEKPPRVLYF
ncbi:MAG: hypothetical protein DWH94_05855 [Planctomycetota bacterium]|nr:MAG: hypothetical protein DWH80_07675 [Planctomycetota bacterium]RLS58243.1 MAG: hypothetical protein DWH94_05855 [Planctomycetota bacterium]